MINKIKTKAIVLAICIVVLVAMSALASAGEKPENLANGVTDDISSTENDTIIVQGWGEPKLEITAKSIVPYSILEPGEEGTLHITISEVGRDDDAIKTEVTANLLNADGCYFSNDLEWPVVGTSKYLGTIKESGSEECSFNITVSPSAPEGVRTLHVTVKYYEWDGIGLFQYGPYYCYADVNFTVKEIREIKTIVSIPDASRCKGETVTVPINISDVENMCGSDIWLNYNKNVVIVDSVSNGDIGTITSNIDNIAGVTKMAWDTTSGKTGDFVFAYVTLKAVGNRGYTSTLNLYVNELYDCNLNNIPYGIDSGTFTVKMQDRMEGAVMNIDVCVGLKDSTLIQLYLVGKRTLTTDQLECADTYDDGEVTLKDSTAIKKWYVDPSYPLWQSPADDHMMKPVPC